MSLHKKISVLLISCFFIAGVCFGQQIIPRPVMKDNVTMLEQMQNIKRENRKEKSMMHKLERISKNTFDQFKANFPQAKNVSWTITDNYNEADFSLDGYCMAAFFDSEDNLVGVGQLISYEQLPKKAIENIGRHYGGYSIQKVIRYQDCQSANELNLYGSSFENKEYFAFLKNPNKLLVLKIAPQGNVSYFSDQNVIEN